MTRCAPLCNLFNSQWLNERLPSDKAGRREFHPTSFSYSIFQLLKHVGRFGATQVTRWQTARKRFINSHLNDRLCIAPRLCVGIGSKAPGAKSRARSESESSGCGVPTKSQRVTIRRRTIHRASRLVVTMAAAVQALARARPTATYKTER